MRRITFAALFTQLLENSEFKNLRAFSDALDHDGYSISYTSLAAYKSFNSIPGFERARAIVNELDYYQLSDADLRSILEFSAESLGKIRADSRTLQRGIRLNPEHISPGMTASELNLHMMERAETLLGENATVNSYFEYLIKKDFESEEENR